MLTVALEVTLGRLLIIVRRDVGIGSPLLTTSQERGSQLDCLLRCLLYLTASSSPRYVGETRFRASPSPRTRRRRLEKTLIFLFARSMEARAPNLLTLLAITWLDAR